MLTLLNIREQTGSKHFPMKSSVSSTRKFKNIGTVNLKTGSICKQTMRKRCPNLFIFPPLKSWVSSTSKFKIIGTANLKLAPNVNIQWGNIAPLCLHFLPLSLKYSLLFLGENWGGTLILSQFFNFRQDLVDFADFSKYLTNSGGKPKKNFFARSA